MSIRNLEKTYFQTLIIRQDLSVKRITLVISYSDNQSTHRRQAIERRDHENALLINYDGTTTSQHTKHGTGSLS